MTFEKIDSSLGSSHIITDLDKYDSLICRVCGSEMDVEKDVPATRSFAGAMMGTNRRTDRWTCFNAGDAWHQQAVAIIRTANNSPSKKIEEMLLEEAEEIISSKTPTKDGWRT